MLNIDIFLTFDVFFIKKQGPIYRWLHHFFLKPIYMVVYIVLIEFHS